MELKKNKNNNTDNLMNDLKQIDFNAISFNEINEIEEFVTPGNGADSCCQ